MKYALTHNGSDKDLFTFDSQADIADGLLFVERIHDNGDREQVSLLAFTENHAMESITYSVRDGHGGYTTKSSVTVTAPYMNRLYATIRTSDAKPYDSIIFVHQSYEQMRLNYADTTLDYTDSAGVAALWAVDAPSHLTGDALNMYVHEHYIVGTPDSEPLIARSTSIQWGTEVTV